MDLNEVSYCWLDVPRSCIYIYIYIKRLVQENIGEIVDRIKPKEEENIK